MHPWEFESETMLKRIRDVATEQHHIKRMHAIDRQIAVKLDRQIAVKLDRQIAVKLDRQIAVKLDRQIAVKLLKKDSCKVRQLNGQLDRQIIKCHYIKRCIKLIFF